MAKFTLTNVRLFAGGADLTTYSNKAEISVEVEEKDATAFSATGGTWKESLGGIHTSTISGSGQWDAATPSSTGILLPDDASFAFVGTQQAVTVCPATAADGAVAYLGGFLRQNYQLGGAVGDIAPWNGQWQGNGPIGRGFVTASPIARTTTGTGSVVNIIGGVPAGGSLVATLHVMSLAGTATPTVSGVIQSSTVVGMSSPTTRLTFTGMSATGGQVQRLTTPTAITDAYYRLSYTITGTTPSIVFASAIGVG